MYPNGLTRISPLRKTENGKNWHYDKMKQDNITDYAFRFGIITKSFME
jgi:hypothetical protein